jgi:cell wall-associated NlpC family hydrolase
MIYSPRHARKSWRSWAAAVLAAAAIILTAVLAITVAAPAHAAVRDGVASGPGGSLAGNEALNWAEAHATGRPYLYGGTGPYGYDCSGLVQQAFLHGAGISLPRTTYGMPSSPHLHWIPLADARRGDILFYGSGHVELDTVWPGVSFGAHDSGSAIGWISWGPWWAPTAAYRVY